MTLTLVQTAPSFLDDLPPLIGLHGFPRSGKDTAATALFGNFGYARIALADPIRNGLLALDPWVRPGDWSEYKDGDENIHVKYHLWPYNQQPRRLSSLLAEFTWDELKASEVWKHETRTLPQRFGTEVGRDTFWESFWLDLAARRMSTLDRVVVTDVRFPNEAAWLRSKGGLLINVVRPGYGAVNNHASEAVIECDHVLHNDSDVDTLLARTRTLVLNHGKETP